MCSLRMRKVFTVITAFALTFALISSSALAATTYLVKDGEIQTVGFINAGEAKDNTIQGPGNWTQLNLGDVTVDAPYMHIIVSATGDTAPAQIAVSDLFTFNLADLGVTLTEEYQDVVLPVEEKGITMLSWLNFMGLDGGSSVYTVKDVFLSDDATPTITVTAEVEETEETAASAEDEAVTGAEAPKTGSSDTLTMISFFGILGSALVLIGLRKYRKANIS